MNLRFEIDSNNRKEWMILLYKHGFDVMNVNETKVEVYIDKDVAKIINMPENDLEGTFDVETGVVVKGIASEVELDIIAYLMGKSALLMNKQHTYYLDQIGFFGPVGTSGYEPDSECYWVEFLLNDAVGKKIVKDWVVRFLPEIRLKELF